ncbi:MAG: hypothetical protein COW04_00480, partial [Deltaproteobacteria bacterium CG12_big_fil_rev_8_21_14_0_65_43_10]
QAFQRFFIVGEKKPCLTKVFVIYRDINKKGGDRSVNGMKPLIYSKFLSAFYGKSNSCSYARVISVY